MKQTDNQAQIFDNPLGYAPVIKLIAKYAIPSILSMLVTAAYNITDQIFIGNVVGMLGNAATNVAFPTVTLTTAFAQMAGIGTAANFNIHMGKKQEDEAKRFLGTGITFMAALGIFIMAVVFVLKRQILAICGATEASMPLALSYLTITNIGLPFFLFSNGGCHMIRADGSPTYSMLCNVSGAILNVFLDALFMFKFGWGIKGAALATITGQIFSFVLCATYFFHMKSFHFSFKMLGIRLNYLVRIMKLGLSNFINQIMLINGKANLVYREESLQVVRVAGKVGQERPLYAGATGKVLGAFQDEEVIRKRLMEEPLTPFTERTITSPVALMEDYEQIRKQGYAISDGELNIETIGIGAPIRDESGGVWAAISIGAPRMRVDATKRERYIFLVCEIAEEMSRTHEYKATAYPPVPLLRQ